MFNNTVRRNRLQKNRVRINMLSLLGSMIRNARSNCALNF
jgi:hypothetical protein